VRNNAVPHSMIAGTVPVRLLNPSAIMRGVLKMIVLSIGSGKGNCDYAYVGFFDTCRCLAVSLTRLNSARKKPTVTNACAIARILCSLSPELRARPTYTPIMEDTTSGST
jgi:hypothetical protein